jgi:hypothetical protein
LVPDGIQENIRREFDRTVRSSSRVQEQFKGRSISSSEKAARVEVQESSQPSRLVGPGRRVGPVDPRGVQGAISAVEETVPSD